MEQDYAPAPLRLCDGDAIFYWPVALYQHIIDGALAIYHAVAATLRW